MLRRFRRLGMVASLGLLGCSGQGPGPAPESEPTYMRSPIIGGTRDTTSNYVVGILIGDMGLCSGSLLAPNLVLTARHCVADTGGEEIICGRNNFGPNYPARDFIVTTDSDLTDGSVDTYYYASEVRTPTPMPVCGNDVALLILSDNIPSSEAAPIEPRLESRPEAAEAFDAVGYGIQNPNDTSGQTAGTRMHAGDNVVYCVGANACSGTDATNSEWVAVAPICSGDSGGPALDDDRRVIGVASRSNADCSAALYSAVDSWKSLVIDAALDAADQGGYSPPSWAAGGTSGVGSGGSGNTGGKAGSGGSTTAGSGGNGGNGTSGSAGSTTGGTSTGGISTAGTSTGGNSSGGTGTSGSNSTGGSLSIAGNTNTGGTLTSGGSTNNGGGGASGRAGSGPVGAGTTGNPLGLECTGPCASGYLCYDADDEPPGICVPPCSTTDTDCPNDYRCSPTRGLCVPDKRREPKDDSGCGCRTAPVNAGLDQAWGILSLAGIFAVRLRRRRRSAP